MKKLKIWSMMMLITMTLPLIIACGGDDDNDTSSNPLVGTWRAEVTTKGHVEYWDLTFTSDYKFTCKETDRDSGGIKDTRTGTYTIINDIVTIKCEGFGTSAFKINGNELTFSEWDHGKIYKKIY